MLSISAEYFDQQACAKSSIQQDRFDCEWKLHDLWFITAGWMAARVASDRFAKWYAKFTAQFRLNDVEYYSLCIIVYVLPVASSTELTIGLSSKLKVSRQTAYADSHLQRTKRKFSWIIISIQITFMIAWRCASIWCWMEIFNKS